MACVFSRLGETSSLERDGLSLKTGARRLTAHATNMGELLLISPRRDTLDWARKPGPSTVHAGQHQYSTRAKHKFHS